MFMKEFYNSNSFLIQVILTLLLTSLALCNPQKCQSHTDCHTLSKPICRNFICSEPSSQEDCSQISPYALFSPFPFPGCQIPCLETSECSVYKGFCNMTCQECLRDSHCPENKKCIRSDAGNACGDCEHDDECGKGEICQKLNCARRSENFNVTDVRIFQAENSNIFNIFLSSDIIIDTAEFLKLQIENISPHDYNFHIQKIDGNSFKLYINSKISIQNAKATLFGKEYDQKYSFEIIEMPSSVDILNIGHPRILQDSVNSLLNTIISIICTSILTLTGIIFLVTSQDNWNIFRNLSLFEGLAMIMLLNIGYPISALDLSVIVSIGTYSFINPFNLFRSSVYTFFIKGAPYIAFNITGIFLDGISGLACILTFCLLLQFLSWLIGPARGEFYQLLRKLGFPFIFGILTYGSHIVFVLAILQLYNPDFTSVFFSISWGIALAVTVGYILFLIYLVIVHIGIGKTHSVQEKVTMIKRKNLIYGYLRGTKDVSVSPFLIIIVIKNLILGTSLVLLASVPLAQVILQLAISVVYVILILILAPFKSNAEARLEIFSEIGIICAKILALAYYSNSSFDVILGINVTFTIILVVNAVYNSLQIIDKCRSYKKRAMEIPLPIRGIGKGMINNNGRVIPMTTTSDTQVNNPENTNDSTFHNTSFDPLKPEPKEVRFNLGESPANRIVRKQIQNEVSQAKKTATVAPKAEENTNSSETPKSKEKPKVTPKDSNPNKPSYLTNMLNSFRAKKNEKAPKIDLIEKNLHIDNLDLVPPNNLRNERVNNRPGPSILKQSSRLQDFEAKKDMMEEKVFLKKPNGYYPTNSTTNHNNANPDIPLLELNPFGIKSNDIPDQYFPHPEQKTYFRNASSENISENRQTINGGFPQPVVSSRRMYEDVPEQGEKKVASSMEFSDRNKEYKFLKASPLNGSPESDSDISSKYELTALKMIQVPVDKHDEKPEQDLKPKFFNYAQEIANQNKKYEQSKKATQHKDPSPSSRSLVDSIYDQKPTSSDQRTIPSSADSKNTTNLTLPSSETPSSKLGKAPESILRHYLLNTISPDKVVKEASPRDETEMATSMAVSDQDRQEKGFKTPMQEDFVPTPKRRKSIIDDTKRFDNFNTFKNFAGDDSNNHSYIYKAEESLPRTIDQERPSLSAEDGKGLAESSSLMVKDLLASLSELKLMLKARKKEKIDAIESDFEETTRENGLRGNNTDIPELGFRVQRDMYY